MLHNSTLSSAALQLNGRGRTGRCAKSGQGDRSNYRVPMHRAAQIPTQSKPLHPVYDDGKGGGWKWWE